MLEVLTMQQVWLDRKYSAKASKLVDKNLLKCF